MKDQGHLVSGGTEVSVETKDCRLKQGEYRNKGWILRLFMAGCRMFELSCVFPVKNRPSRLTSSIVFLSLFIFTLVVRSSAMDVTLEWDRNTDADYYVVYYGTESGKYVQSSPEIPQVPVDQPSVQHTVAGLADSIWYFSVKAFNVYGNSSDFSDEVEYLPYYSPLSIAIESPVNAVTINQGEFVNFKGYVSGGAVPLSYNWNFGIGGPAGSAERDPGNITFDNPGQYTVTFTVTDANNEVKTRTVVVNVTQPEIDIYPVIEISSPSVDVTITAGDAVQFSSRVVAGNAPYTYYWNFGTAEIADSNLEAPGSVIYPSAGTYTVTLTVVDKDGDISTDTVTVTAGARYVDIEPVAAISGPTGDVTIVQGGSVSFSGAVSGGDAPLTHSWTFADSGISPSSLEDPGNRIFNTTGIFTVTYSVTDSDGDVSSDTVTVTVLAPDTSPVASMTSPGSNVTITKGGAVNFQATVSNGNAPYTHLWNFGLSGLASRTVEDPGSLTFTTLGTFTVTYTVRDSDGDVSSAARTVTVVDPDTNPTAVITSPSAGVTIVQGGSVNFAASATGGNPPYSHTWNFGAAGVTDKAVEDPGSVAFYTTGTFTVTYTVKDSDGDTNSATRTVTVSASNANADEGSDNPAADPGLGSYILVSTTQPGAKSTDNFIPPTENSVVNSESDKPTIDVRDSQLRHLLWLRCGWANYNKVNGESRIATGDINGDGKDEVVIGLSGEKSTPTMPGGFFQILDANYSHMAWGRVEWADYNEANGETWPTCGDVDGDGKDEIVVGFGKEGGGYVEVFGWVNGQVVHKYWLRLQWPDYNEVNGEVRPVCADIDDDGLDDIIAGLGSIGGDPSIPGGKFEVFSRKSGAWVHVLWGEVDWSEYAEINGETWPAAGDIDGDGKIELVVGLGHGGEGQMAVFEFLDGEAQQSEWVQIQWPEYNDVYGETRPVCGDVNNDGKDEVILGWSTVIEGSESLHYFKVLSYNPQTGSWVNFKDSKSADGVDIDSVPVKGSVDQDSKIYIGVSAVEETPVPSPVKPAAGGGGGGGCFIGSVFE